MGDRGQASGVVEQLRRLGDADFPAVADMPGLPVAEVAIERLPPVADDALSDERVRDMGTAERLAAGHRGHFLERERHSGGAQTPAGLANPPPPARGDFVEQVGEHPVLRVHEQSQQVYGLPSVLAAHLDPRRPARSLPRRRRRARGADAGQGVVVGEREHRHAVFRRFPRDLGGSQHPVRLGGVGNGGLCWGADPLSEPFGKRASLAGARSCGNAARQRTTGSPWTKWTGIRPAMTSRLNASLCVANRSESARKSLPIRALSAGRLAGLGARPAFSTDCRGIATILRPFAGPRSRLPPKEPTDAEPHGCRRDQGRRIPRQARAAERAAAGSRGGGGCSGFQYQLALDEESRDGDRIIEQNGVRMLVDERRPPLPSTATQIDYVEDLMGAGFRFNNPNAVSSCGCGGVVPGLTVRGESAPPATGGCADTRTARRRRPLSLWVGCADPGRGLRRPFTGAGAIRFPRNGAPPVRAPLTSATGRLPVREAGTAGTGG